MFKSRLIIAALFATVLLGPLAHAKTLDWQQMRDWSVYCRDNRYCIAITSGTSREGDKLVLKLERSAKPDSSIFVTVKPDGRALQVGDDILIEIVGHEHALSGKAQKIYEGNEAALSITTQSLDLRKLREGRFADVVIGFQQGHDRVTYAMSLQGVASVLAMMDAVQGRLDRLDAAIISGGEGASLTSHYDLSAGKAPPAPESDEKEGAARDPEENITYPSEGGDTSEAIEDGALGSATLVYSESDLPERVLMAGYRVFNCDFPATLKAHGAQVIGLEPGLFLYLVPCQTGDVNVEHFAALEDAGEVETLEFQEPASKTGKPVSTIINPAWDNDRQVLTSYRHFSSAYDCGRFERHNLSIQDRSTTLAEARRKDNCDGTTTLPEEYPLIWNGEGD
ncbi:MAG: DUF1176 domain-containing protein [Ahrensia sp.]|nr:DUF1176 domain-containing protein [Ahrensia sp.]